MEYDNIKEDSKPDGKLTVEVKILRKIEHENIIKYLYTVFLRAISILMFHRFAYASSDMLHVAKLNFIYISFIIGLWRWFFVHCSCKVLFNSSRCKYHNIDIKSACLVPSGMIYFSILKKRRMSVQFLSSRMKFCAKPPQDFTIYTANVCQII